MPRVVRDHDPGFALDFFLRAPFVQVRDQSLRRAAHAEKVHRVRPDAGELRPPVLSRVAPLRFGHDFPDSAPAESAGAESERLIKPVVEFRPFFRRGQLRHDLLIKRGRRAAQKRPDILSCRFQQFSRAHCVSDLHFQAFAFGGHGSPLFRHPCHMQAKRACSSTVNLSRFEAAHEEATSK